MSNRLFAVNWCTLSPEVRCEKIPNNWGDIDYRLPYSSILNGSILVSLWVISMLLPCLVAPFPPQLYGFSGLLFHFSIYGSLFCPFLLCSDSTFVYFSKYAKLNDWAVGPEIRYNEMKSTYRAHSPIAPPLEGKWQFLVYIQKMVKKKCLLSFWLPLASLFYPPYIPHLMILISRVR